MAAPPDPAGPFHAGELAIQRRYGIAERMQTLGRRMIHARLPARHGTFFERLSLLLAGTVDPLGHPWASVLSGAPGFVKVVDDRTLRVAATPLAGDPLHRTLRPGVEIGLLGIMLDARRRARVNGTVISVTSDGFTVHVEQSFGNCPKYIHGRHLEPAAEAPGADVRPSLIGARLPEPLRELVRGADTLFIASSAGGRNDNGGADVSHRGGRPGFVRVDGDGMLALPDHPGNNVFSTLGNLLLNPRAGLLFVDFAAGDLLYLTGTSEVIFEGPALEGFEGAERVLRFALTRGVHLPGALALRAR